MLFYFSILLLKNFRFFAFFHGSRMTSYIFFQFFFTLRLMSNLQRVFSPKMSPVRCLYQKLIFCKFTLIICQFSTFHLLLHWSFVLSPSSRRSRYSTTVVTLAESTGSSIQCWISKIEISQLDIALEWEQLSNAWSLMQTKVRPSKFIKFLQKTLL